MCVNTLTNLFEWYKNIKLKSAVKIQNKIGKQAATWDDYVHQQIITIS